jgi:hypothetical protein
MKSTVHDFDTQRSECCAWLGLLKSLLSAAMVAAIALRLWPPRKTRGLAGGRVSSIGLRGVAGLLRVLLRTRSRGVPAAPVPDALSGPVAR